MSTCQWITGDSLEVARRLPEGAFDVVVTSPPFLALRSYLPADHPDKAKEMGQENTPGEFVQALLEHTAEWRRLLAPHGSIVVELGDTYAGSGGAGGDYDDGGLRDGQPKFTGSAKAAAWSCDPAVKPRGRGKQLTANGTGSEGWPMDKSLAGIPQAYQLSLAYGINVLTGQPSPAGRWRVRNVAVWARPNPPVGDEKDKWRRATSYVIVACLARDRYWDIEDLRTQGPGGNVTRRSSINRDAPGYHTDDDDELRVLDNPAGAPPHDFTDAWASAIDAMLLAEPGLRGKDIVARLEDMGLVDRGDLFYRTTSGYRGAHYATFPPHLVRTPILSMTPQRVCRTCGQPSRRITAPSAEYEGRLGKSWADKSEGRTKASKGARSHHSGQPAGDRIQAASYVTVGWTDCGHGSAVCDTCSVHVPLADAEEPGEGQARPQEAPEDVRGVRNGILGENSTDESVRTELLDEAGPPGGTSGDRATTDEQPPGKEAPRRKAGGDLRAGVGTGGDPGSAQERMDDGAPAGDAGASRSPAGEVGAGPPSERGEDGQPPPQPRGRDARPSRRGGPVPELFDGVPCSLTDGCAGTMRYVADHWRPGRVLDPFGGTGTTGLVACEHGFDATCIDLDESNLDLARERLGLFLVETDAASWSDG